MIPWKAQQNINTVQYRAIGMAPSARYLKFSNQVAAKLTFSQNFTNYGTKSRASFDNITIVEAGRVAQRWKHGAHFRMHATLDR